MRRLLERILSLIKSGDDQDMQEHREFILEYYLNVYRSADSAEPEHFVVLNSAKDCHDLRQLFGQLNDRPIECAWFAKRNLACSILIPRSSLISHWAMIYKFDDPSTSSHVYILVEYISDGVQFYVFRTSHDSSSEAYLNVVFAWMFGFTDQIRFKSIDPLNLRHDDGGCIIRVSHLLDSIESLIVNEGFVDENYDMVKKNCQKFALRLLEANLNKSHQHKHRFTESANVYTKRKAPTTLVKVYYEDLGLKRVTLKKIKWDFNVSF